MYEEQRAKYYGVITTNARQALESKMQEINERLARMEGDEQLRLELYKQIDAIKKEEELAIANAEHYAEVFAKINTDGAVEMALKALKLFEAGKIKEAIALMDEEKLREDIQIFQAMKKNARKLSSQSDTMIQQTVETFMIKAHMYATNLQYGEAFNVYQYAVEGDSTNCNNLMEIARFCGNLNQQERSIAFFQQALRHGKSLTAYQKAELLKDLGYQFVLNNQFSQAHSTLAEALEIVGRLGETDASRFEPLRAEILHRQGVMYKNQKGYDKSKEAYMEAYRIKKRLAEEDPGQYELLFAVTQNNLGSLHWELEEYDKAKLYLQGTLDIYERLAQDDPQKYRTYISMIQTSLGNLFQNTKAYDKAEEAYLEALGIHRQLSIENPWRFEPFLSLIQNNLGGLYRKQEAYDKAKEIYLEALEIRKRLAKDNPQRYEGYVASILKNLGFIYLKQEIYDKAEEAFLEALETRKRLAKNNPQRYEGDVAATQFDLGQLYQDQKAYDKAEEAYLKVLEIRQRLAKDNPLQYKLKLSTTQNHMGRFYRKMKSYYKADEYYLKALEVRKQLATDNPDRYNVFVANTARNISRLHQDLLENTLDMKYQTSGLTYARMSEEVLSIYSTGTRDISDDLRKTALLLRYFENITREGAFVNPRYMQVQSLKKKNQKESDTPPKVANQEQSVTILEAIFREYPENDTIVSKLAKANGILARNYLFVSQFKKSEQVAKKGLKIDDSQEWIHSILALALLYQDKLSEAKAIYVQFKGEPYNKDKSWEEVFLNDLSDLEAAGISHPDFEKIKKLFEETN